MTSKNMNINTILALHFAGEILTDEQELYLIEWVCQNKEEYRRLTKIFQTKKQSKEVFFDANRAWSQINQNISESHKAFNINQLLHLFPYAACIAVICGIALFFLNTDKDSPIRYNNITSTLLEVTLPDSSSVTLYPQSEILYIADAKIKERKTELKGKAFFKVKPDANHPFIVRNNNTFIRVLGTSFLVENKTNSETEIFVREGIVQVSNNNEKVILKTDQQAVVNNTEIRKTEIKNQAEVFDKHIKQKIYKEIYLSQVIEDIQNEFNIHIIIDESLQYARISSTIKFVKIEDILSEICYICNCKYKKISDKTYKLFRA